MTPSNTDPSRLRPSFGTLFWRGLRLRCPACGCCKMFCNWMTMRDPCDHCGRKYDRSPGYLLGSIYVNYGVTALLVVVLYFSLYFGKVLTSNQLLAVMGTFTLLFPMWFFRYARALWIALDELFDPWPNEQEVRELANQEQKKQES